MPNDKNTDSTGGPLDCDSTDGLGKYCSVKCNMQIYVTTNL